MTFTKDIEAPFAGLSLVLKTAKNFTSSTPLALWLSQAQPSPNWIPLPRLNGVTKVMPVLPKPVLYPNLMQSICQRISQDSLVEWEQKPYELTGVEIDTHALHIIQVSISASKPLPPTLGRAIHALCFQWFAIADPALAEHLHQQDSMPMTLVMQYNSSQKMYLRISLLRKELLAPLLWGLSANLGGEVELAGVLCRLSDRVNISQTSSFEKLAQVVNASDVQKNCAIALQFLSPTSFKQNKTVQPFPLPELVFNGLLRRWNRFAPQELQFPAVEWESVVCAYDLKTHALKMEAGAEIGVQGWVKYRFLDEEQAKIATILAHFASFAGVGRKTAMGMGQVRLFQSKI
ncbi:CRISPR system precrRNA processing endoribonuclease RAMP protein Cas6 [Scytonema sp. NUACC26]|uniref:CRISPR system precrRNA processing endoribonuclease RAMP protein Cas6 n=1 Tax=Scytonema sp. NUACC26 TaxID=3140176 RepID=UPI0034DC4243